MKLLDRYHEGRAGVYASIVDAGPVRIGDPLHLLP
jgi:MOSC domain-containing protein YiiM